MWFNLFTWLLYELKDGFYLTEVLKGTMQMGNIINRLIDASLRTARYYHAMKGYLHIVYGYYHDVHSYCDIIGNHVSVLDIFGWKVIHIWFID